MLTVAVPVATLPTSTISVTILGYVPSPFEPSENSADQRNSKRHPTLMDNVIIGSGAHVLGPIIVGKCARIGANTVVLRDVPEHATMVGNPAKNISTNTDSSFKPYGVRDIDDNE